MGDLHRMHYVAEHYHHLQGLRLLPLGVALLAFPFRARFAPAGVPPRWAFVGLVVLAMAASVPISRYYRRTFGQLAAPRWRTGALTWIAAFMAFVTLAIVQVMRPMPVMLPLLFVSAALARLGLAAGRLRVHYLWIAGILAAVAFRPVMDALPWIRVWGLEGLAGASLIVAAIGDDLALRRVMRPPPQQERTAA